MATYLIVGSDRGIGLAICEQLHARGDEVIAACLGSGDELVRQGIRVIRQIDVTSDEAAQRLGETLRGDDVRLDVVIHVAGVLGLDELGSIDFDDVRRQIEINTIGPLRIAQAVLDRLGEGAKLGIVTSRVGARADHGSGGL